MNKPIQIISRVHAKARFGVIILAILVLLAFTLPGKAARLFNPDAITNQQTAAILGAEHLLRAGGPVYHFNYLPSVVR